MIESIPPSRETSYSLRPLREPLPKSRTHTPHQYGRVTRSTRVGGSLPILPTDVTASKNSSSHSFHSLTDNSSTSITSRPVKDPPSFVSSRRSPKKEPQQRVKLEPTAARVTSRSITERPPKGAASKSITEKNARDAPDAFSLPLLFPTTRGAEPAGSLLNSAYHSSVEEKTESLSDESEPRGVHFSEVHIYYYEELDRPTLKLQLDKYERQRGPTRPPTDFLKSEAELRSIRRMQQIEDARADEEWKAIQEAACAIRKEIGYATENSFEASDMDQTVIADQPIYGDIASKLQEEKKHQQPVASKKKRFPRLFNKRGKRSNPIANF